MVRETVSGRELIDGGDGFNGPVNGRHFDDLNASGKAFHWPESKNV